ncbi:MAG TPA: hypothetical protein DCF84_04230 [Bacteroidetes bacterium]|nr:hypothetical protein [Bacteroidota bacterium]
MNTNPAINQWLSEIPEERKEAINILRQLCKNKLPKGFEECINYNMLSYVIPKSIYPEGYHCAPELPLPFLSIGNQKKHIGFYHMGIYAIPQLMQWFTSEYPKHSKFKLDMGKSCIRLKRMDDIPYELFAELCTKVSSKEWIATYENAIKR